MQVRNGVQLVMQPMQSGAVLKRLKKLWQPHKQRLTKRLQE
jgi:hypothetical protein